MTARIDLVADLNAEDDDGLGGPTFGEVPEDRCEPDAVAIDRQMHADVATIPLKEGSHLQDPQQPRPVPGVSSSQHSYARAVHLQFTFGSANFAVQSPVIILRHDTVVAQWEEGLWPDPDSSTS